MEILKGRSSITNAMQANTTKCAHDEMGNGVLRCPWMSSRHALGISVPTNKASISSANKHQASRFDVKRGFSS